MDEKAEAALGTATCKRAFSEWIPLRRNSNFNYP